MHDNDGAVDVPDRRYSGLIVWLRYWNHAIRRPKYAKSGVNLQCRHQYQCVTQRYAKSGQRQYQRHGINRSGNAGTAKGVGVQLLYNGSPLVMNGRLLLKQSAGGQETLPLTARYYQTLTTVESGSANASATLTITYQ